MVTGLKNSYTNSTYSGASQISALISTTGSTALLNYGNGLLSNALGGSAVVLATASSTGTGTSTPETADPYAGNVVLLLHFDGNFNDAT